MFLRASGSLSRLSSVPARRAARAASVGAKAVNGPGALRVSTRPAAVAGWSSVLKEPAAFAVSTMSTRAVGGSVGLAGAAVGVTGAAVGVAAGFAVGGALVAA